MSSAEVFRRASVSYPQSATAFERHVMEYSSLAVIQPSARRKPDSIGLSCRNTNSEWITRKDAVAASFAKLLRVASCPSRTRNAPHWSPIVLRAEEYLSRFPASMITGSPLISGLDRRYVAMEALEAYEIANCSKRYPFSSRRRWNGRKWSTP